MNKEEAVEMMVKFTEPSCYKGIFLNMLFNDCICEL